METRTAVIAISVLIFLSTVNGAKKDTTNDKSKSSRKTRNLPTLKNVFRRREINNLPEIQLHMRDYFRFVVKTARNQYANDLVSPNPYGFTDVPRDYEPWRNSPSFAKYIEFVKHKRNKIRCVLKGPRRDFPEEMFDNEAVILQELSQNASASPFIVRQYYHFRYHDRRYLVLEYLEGKDLITISDEYNARKEPIPDEVILDYMAQMSLALGELIKHKIMYDDFKLDNFVLTNEGRVVLVDFGTSVKLKSYDELFDGLRYGTDIYESPEKHFFIRCKEHQRDIVLRNGGQIGYTYRNDLFSLGVTLYMLYCSTEPFDEKEWTDIAFKYVLYGGEYDIEPDDPCDRLKNDVDAWDLALRLMKFNESERLGASNFNELLQHKYFERAGGQKFFDELTKRAEEARKREQKANNEPADPSQIPQAIPRARTSRGDQGSARRGTQHGRSRQSQRKQIGAKNSKDDSKHQSAQPAAVPAAPTTTAAIRGGRNSTKKCS